MHDPPAGGINAVGDHDFIPHPRRVHRRLDGHSRRGPVGEGGNWIGVSQIDIVGASQRADRAGKTPYKRQRQQQVTPSVAPISFRLVPIHGNFPRFHASAVG